MSGRTFSLTEILEAFVDRQVAQGRHATPSDVVREALDRYRVDLEDEQADLQVVEEVADRGAAAIARGEFRTVSDEADRRSLIEDLERRAAVRAGGRT